MNSLFRRKHSSKGFTLVEMIVVVALVSTMLLVGVPAVVKAMKRARLESTARLAQVTVNAARLQAVKSGGLVGVYFGAPASYPTGVVMPFLDSGTVNGQYDPGEEFKRLAPVILPSATVIFSTDLPNGVVAFNALGQAVNLGTGALLTNCGDATNGCAVFIGDKPALATTPNLFRIAIDNPGTGRTTLRKKDLASATYVDTPWKWTY